MGRTVPRWRVSMPLVCLAIAVLAPACTVPPSADTVAPEAATAAAASRVMADDGVAMVRRGPWQVRCFKEDELVFEHPEIYRVYRDDGDNAGWVYETDDGLRFRGRIGENVNCVWDRRDESSAPLAGADYGAVD